MVHQALCFLPITARTPRALILGSMPGIKSLQEQQYYAYAQNSFWRIMGRLFDAPIASYPQRKAIIKNNELALWDVLKSCQRHGSLDSRIDPTTIKVNNFSTFLKKHSKITRIFFNGTTAEKEFLRRVMPTLPKPIAARLVLKRLPSTSPARTINFEQKLKAWKIIKGK